MVGYERTRATRGRELNSLVKEAAGETYGRFTELPLY